MFTATMIPDAKINLKESAKLCRSANKYGNSQELGIRLTLPCREGRKEGNVLIEKPRAA